MLIHLFSDTDHYEDFEMSVTAHGKILFSELHEGIQKALNYDASQMAAFNIFNNAFEKTHEISLLDMGLGNKTLLMGDLCLEDIITDEKQIINYLFDFFSERHFTLSISSIEGSDEEIFSIDVKGKVPPQIVVDDSGFDADLAQAGASPAFDLGLDDELDDEFGAASFDNIDDYEL